MSEFTDRATARYLAQNPQLAREYHLDPATHQRIHMMQQTLNFVERAMRDEDVDEDVQRRVVNRVIWGEPEGLVDVHARFREQVLTAYDLPIELTDAWKANHARAGSARPDEEPTP